mmetsp:Transcript_23411/g.32813  ORF Transcript_23411/g.32813 Transcript_23411/m.32813 type:complete len:308 (+) Transcript_23411:67-990(+)
MMRTQLLLLTALMIENHVSGFCSTSITANIGTSRLIKKQQSPTIETRLSVAADGEKERTGGRAKFSGLDDSGGATNAFDYALQLISSDVGSIVLGLIGLFICVGHRLSGLDDLSTETMGQETRSDLLAVFASGAVLLNGVSKLDVTSALAESVQLEGVRLSEIKFIGGSLDNNSDIAWAMDSVLTATPAKTAALLRDENGWSISALGGVVPEDPELQQAISVTSTPILDRFRKDMSKESYLPTLQALPGRVEFTYLPQNAQEALLLPVSSSNGGKSVLVLGSDTAKSFTPRDVAWCQVLASRLGTFI